MQAYERSTAPLIDFYHRLGLLLTVIASGTPEEICARTIAALDIIALR
jgi:adenylate kinase family enzyme